MPDFEIRYFLADDSLALVRVNSFASDAEAEAYARANQEHYVRFEVRRFDGLPAEGA
jgi:hypothetical protein